MHLSISSNFGGISIYNNMQMPLGEHSGSEGGERRIKEISQADRVRRGRSL